MGLFLGLTGTLSLTGAERPGGGATMSTVPPTENSSTKKSAVPPVVKPPIAAWPPAGLAAAVTPAKRLATLAKARSMVGWTGTAIRVDGKSFRADCAGFVSACYYSAGVNLSQGASSAKGSQDTACQILWDRCKGRAITDRNRKPKTGDLVFFDNTWDRNGNRLRDDRLTHIGLVDSVDADGAIHCLHFSSGMVKRFTMDPARSGVAQKNGKTVNDWLRRAPPGEKASPQDLAGALFTAFATP
jgi:cell wall-associated NlpC family hydrolase